MRIIGSKYIMALVLTILAATAAEAATKELDRAAFEVLIKQPLTQADRKQAATALYNYWVYFDNRIPRNTPEDEQWLKSENSSGDVQRMIAVVDSKPRARASLVSASSYCVDIFNKLAADNDNLQLEMYLWMKSTPCYSNNERIIRELSTIELAFSRSSEDVNFTHLSSFMPYYASYLAESFKP